MDNPEMKNGDMLNARRRFLKELDMATFSLTGMSN